MIRSFFKDSFIYSINTFLSKGISFLLIPLYTSRLLPGDYGVIDIFTVFTSFINVIIALEITQAVARYFPSIRYIERKRVYASSAMWFTFFVYGVFVLIAFMFASFFNGFITSGKSGIGVYKLAIINVFITGVFYFFQEQLRWSHKTKQYSIVSIIYTLVTFSTCAYLVVGEDQKVEGYFTGMITGGAVGILMSVFFNRELYRAVIYFRVLKKMIMFSSPLVFSSISVMISMYTDRILVNHFLGLDKVGLYGVAFRFASVTGLLMVGFQGALIPLVYKHYNEKSTPSDIAKIFNFFALFSIVLMSGIVLFSKEMIVWLTHPNYYEAWSLIPIICLSNIFSVIYIFTPGLSIAKKTSYIAYINIVAAAVNIGLNYLLIPLLGVHGSAVATLFSYISVFFVNLLFSQKYYPIPYDKKTLFTIIGLFSVLAIISAIFEWRIWQYQHEITLTSFAIKCVFFGLLVLAMSRIPAYKMLPASLAGRVRKYLK